MKDLIESGVIPQAVKEILPNDLDVNRLGELVMNGQLQTYLSTLSNPFLTNQLIAIINGQAKVHWSPEDIWLKSDGRTGKDWIDFFKGEVSDSAKKLLGSKLFKQTTGMQYRIEFAPGRLGDDGIPNPHGVRFGEEQQKPLSVSLELGCLLREAISEDRHGEMKVGYGISIMAVHTPDPDEQQGLGNLFLVAKYNDHDKLCAYHKQVISGGYLFAFCTKQVSES